MTRAFISIDGVLLAVAVLVMLFCTAAFIRISTEPSAAHSGASFLTLSEGEDLLAFEDFNFGSAAWTPAATSARMPGLGPVLGPFTNEPVERSVLLPVDTVNLRVRFDLHLHGTWAEADRLSVSLGGQEVLTITLAARETDSATLNLSVQNSANVDVDVRQTIIGPRRADPALPDSPEEPVLSLNVTLQMAPPSDLMSLGLGAEPSVGASWSLDNLAIVAATDGEA